MPGHSYYFACAIVNFDSEGKEDEKLLKDALQKALDKAVKGLAFNVDGRTSHTVKDIEVFKVGVTLSRAP